MTPRWPYTLVLVAFLALIGARWDSRTGFTSVLRFSEGYAKKRIAPLRDLPVATFPTGNGYDGQFYVQLALSPTLRDPGLTEALDAPAYRARRILPAWTAWMLGFGRPWLVVNAFALLNVFCWLALAWLLPRWLPGAGARPFAAWACVLLGVGCLESVRLSLTDLPATLLLALGVCALETGRRRGAVLAFAGAALTKETSLFVCSVFTGSAGRTFSWRTSFLGTLGVALPLLLWSAYVSHVFGFDASAGQGNFDWPGLAWVRHVGHCVQALAAGDFDGRYSFGLLAALSLAWQALWLWRHRRPENAWWRIGAAYALLLPFLGDGVWHGYWAALRAVLPLTLAYTLLIRDDKRFWLLLLLGQVTLPHALWRFLP